MNHAMLPGLLMTLYMLYLIGKVALRKPAPVRVPARRKKEG